MSDVRLPVWLVQMQAAARDACDFSAGMTYAQFAADRRTQRAAVMSLLIVGEIATRISEREPTFAARHSAIAWQSMRGMRNRIAHGYFELDLEVVWNTLQQALPALIAQLDAAIADIAGGPSR